MMLHFWRAIWGMLACSGPSSLVIGAESGIPESPLTENIIDRTSQTVDWFSSDLGLLIGIVVLALVVISRIRKAP